MNTSAPIDVLPVRQLQTDFSGGFAGRWHGGDAFRSAYFNALSMSFPAGEQAFINAVKACAERLPADPAFEALRALTKDFAAQEATHRHVHAQYNAELARQGFENHVESRIWARYEQAKGMHPMHHLAITAAYEHYTAVFSEVLLAHPAMMEKAEPQMRKIWLWHALEETEHKAIAFDLYVALKGNYRWRARWFFYTTITFAADTVRQTVHNLWRDGTLFHPRTWASAAQFLFGRPSRGGGWAWLTFAPLACYLKRDFHPWQQDNSAHAVQYRSAHAQDWRIVR
jgi:uncharacterized protein